ncbi:MAG TPA: STAS domain-containing protein, partial [Cyclobacteriaceae bacterium]
GIILLVAYSLIDFKSIQKISRSSKSEIAVLIITSISILFLDLQFAILLGVFFSLIFYLMRTSKPKVVSLAPNLIEGERKFMNVDLYQIQECPQLHIIRIDGSLFFGAVESIKNALYELSETRKYILIIGSGINFIDVSGAEMLVAEAERLRSLGGGLYLSHLKKPVRDFLTEDYRAKIGESHFFYSKETAIKEIYGMLEAQTCQSCRARIFNECNEHPK